MAANDAFTGAKTAMMMLDAFAGAVGKEIGMERTLGLMAQTCENMAAIMGKRLKQQASDQEIDARAAWSMLKASAENLGITFQVAEESPNRVFVKSGRCSVYEAAQALGMDNKTIETMCKFSSNRFDDALVKQLNPSLSFRMLKFRSSAEEPCEEELIQG